MNSVKHDICFKNEFLADHPIEIFLRGKQGNIKKLRSKAYIKPFFLGWKSCFWFFKNTFLVDHRVLELINLVAPLLTNIFLQIGIPFRSRVALVVSSLGKIGSQPRHWCRSSSFPQWLGRLWHFLCHLGLFQPRIILKLNFKTNPSYIKDVKSTNGLSREK